jgi:hypothetical protein
MEEVPALVFDNSKKAIGSGRVFIKNVTPA